MIDKKQELFIKGIELFNNKEFYNAHEYWEELWLDYKLDDSKFIQGLIQLAVSYYHLFNNNLNGAKSMIKKCLGKLEDFDKSWGIDVDNLKNEVQDVNIHFNNINNTNEFIDSYIILLKVSHE